MIDASELVAGRWWRFSRYEFDGWYIRPGRGAKLEEYDPWADYHTSLDPPARTHPAGKRASQPPYMDLVDMLAELPFHKGSEGEPSAIKPAGKATILEWCASHGLLGVLPQRAQAVALAPIHEPSGSFAAQRRYVRTSDREWVESVTRVFLTRPTPKTGLRVRRPEPPEAVAPHVLLQETDSTEVVQEPLSKTWGQFFPSIAPSQRDDYSYPRPLSPEFWGEYAESLHHFLDAARLFSVPLRMLDEARSLVDPEDDPQAIVKWELRRLNGLVAPISPSLAFGPSQEFRQRWSSPSLLASFAMMALLDLAEGRVRACAECGRLFVTDAYQTRYCKPAHSNTARKRKYLAKQRRASESPDGEPQRRSRR